MDGIRILPRGTVAKQLRTDFPLPARPEEARWAQVGFAFGPTLSRSLDDWAQGDPLRLWAALAATLQICLQRYQQADDVALGSPLPQPRSSSGADPGALTFETRIDGRRSFGQLAEDLLAFLPAACASPPADACETPAALVLEGIHGPLPDLRQIVTFRMRRGPEEVTGEVAFRSDLLRRTTAERLARHFTALLQHGLADPGRSSRRLIMLSAAERFQLLEEWNQTRSEYPRNATIGRLFDEQAAVAPHAAALAFDEGASDGQPDCIHTLSYAELQLHAERLAALLRGFGMIPDSTAAVCMQRRLETFVGILGIVKAGGAYLPLNPEDPPARLEQMLDDAKPLALLTWGAWESGLPMQTRLIGLQRVWNELPEAASLPERSAPPTEAGNLAYTIYTSGSTGKPKGVQVTHRNVARLVRGTDYMPLGPREIFFQLTAPTFDVSVFEIWGSLLNGSLLAIAPPGRPTLDDLAAAIRRHRVSTLWLTTGLFQLMVDNRLEALDGLDRLLTGGDSVPVPQALRVVRELEGCCLINGYGPTENTVFSTCFSVRSPEDIGETVPIGRPIANSGAYLLDADLEPVALGVPGKLYAAGDGVARGYLGRPSLTAERFIPDPFSLCPGQRFYDTGDLARWLPNGQIEFLGRFDHQVKIRGYRVELGEVEAALRALPGVLQATAVIREDRPGDKRLVGYAVVSCKSVVGCQLSVVSSDPESDSLPLPESPSASALLPQPTTDNWQPTTDSLPVPDSPSASPPLPQPTTDNWQLTTDSLLSRLAERLPEYMLPSHLILLDRLPLTPNGKVDRRALPAPQIQSEAAEQEEPRGAFEQMLAAVWAEVLGVERVGRQEGFLELGGHSLAATQIAARLRSACQVEIPVGAVFEFPTFAAFAEHIQQAALPSPQQPEVVRQPRSGHLPLSFAQERVWLLERLSPGLFAYNFQAALDWEGNLNPVALKTALTEIVRRHEIYRTSFPESGGRPCQRVHAPFEAPLWMVDLSGLNDARQAVAEVERNLWQITRRPFDVTRVPLVRWPLFRLSPRRHLLLHGEHHLVHDGWGFARFMSELKALYGAFSTGRPSPLPEPTEQFADVAAWERNWMQGEVLEEQLRLWKERLKGIPPLLELPADRHRPSDFSYRGSGLKFRLTPALSQDLRALSRRQGCSLFMTLLAAFKILLCRWTGQDDVVVGTGVANRLTPESERQLGMLVNNLPLRSRLAGNPRFGQVVERVRATSLQAYACQAVPFEALVQALGSHRQAGLNPLIQALFSFHDSQVPRLEFEGLRARLDYRMNGTAKFDLNVVVVPGAEDEAGRESMLVLWEAAADLFDHTRVRRMSRQFRRLLQSAVEDPQRRLWDLPMIDEAERLQLLDWGVNRRRLPSRPLIPALFRAQAEHRPDACAVVYGKSHQSYLCLNACSDRWAGSLARLGTGPESRVGVLMERCLEMPAAWLGALKAGAAYLPLDPDYPPQRLQFMLHDSASSVLLCRRQDLSRLPLQQLPAFVLDEAAAPDDPSELPPACIEPHSLAYVMYTSGSTGRPKGVEVVHQGVVRLVCNADYVQLGPGDRVAQASSSSFDAATFEVWGALLNGAVLQGIERRTLLSPSRLQGALTNGGVSALFLTAALFNQTAREIPAAFRRLRHLIFGGDAADPRSVAQVLQAEAPQRLLNGYGPTECTTFAVCGLVRQVAADALTVPIGRPISNASAHIVDAFGNLAPIGVPGELLLGGKGLARGYQRRPALTAERFVPDPFSGRPGSRLYRTGDLVRTLPDGAIGFLGRIDHQVKIRGFRVEPGEIESHLLEHPSVAQAAVLALPDPWGGKQLVGYVVAGERVRNQESGIRKKAEEDGLESEFGFPTDNRQLTTDNWIQPEYLRLFLSNSLPDYMIPAFFVFLEKLPLTPNGKVDRQALQRIGLPEQADAAAGTAPRDPFEARLMRIWQQVLGREGFGVEDDFFSLGGHSLMATRIVSRVRQSFAIDLPVKAVFECLTIAQLARRIASAVPGQAPPPIVRADRSGPLPLSFAQQRLWLLDRLTPNNPFYVSSAAWKLEGPLDVAALHSALRAVVQRHETLRTRFPEQGGRPVQVIEDKAALPLLRLDLTALPPDRRSREQNRIIEEQSQRPFNLSQGPLVRATLILLNRRNQEDLESDGSGSKLTTDNRQLTTESASCLLLNLHHIVSDGWSLGILCRELGEEFAVRSSQFAVEGAEKTPDSDSKLRTANCELRTDQLRTANCELPTLPVQYADFAVWQRNWLRGEVLERLLGYWEQRLQGAPHLELPCDRPRPAQRAYRGDSLEFGLDPALSEALERLGRRCGATLYMTLLAAFQTLLHRWTGQQDVVTGSLLANRNYSEIEGLIGFFVNTLPMRSRFEGPTTFAQLLEQVGETALEAIAHQDLPFDKLVEHLHIERDLGRNPVFQTLFSLHEAPLEQLSLAGLRVRSVPRRIRTARFDLTVQFLGSGPSGRKALLIYDRDLFDRTSMLRFVGHYRRLLEGAAADPEQKVSELPLLSRPERHQLLQEWSGEERELGEAVVHKLFEGQAALNPDAVALVRQDCHLSYAELDARADQMAGRIRAGGWGLGAGGAGRGPRSEVQGPRPTAEPWPLDCEPVVGVCLPRSLQAPMAFLAVLKSGAAYLPLDPSYPEQRLAMMIEDSGAALLLCDRHSERSSIRDTPACLQVDSDWGRPGKQGNAAPLPAHPLQTAALIYTSGSTGRPKGAAILHRGVVRLVRCTRYIDFSRSQVFLQSSSLSFDASTREVWGPLLNGGRLAIYPENRPTLDGLVRAVRRFGVTTLSATSALFQQFDREQLGGLRGLRQLLVGGDVLSPSQARKALEQLPGLRLLNGYGPTENTTYTTSHVMRRAEDVGQPVPIGRPITNSQVLLLDTELRPVPCGVPGLLWTAGEGLARGYWNRPADTARSFRPHPFAARPGRRLYASGDRARFLQDGRIEFLGRADRQVKVRGFRIEPGEVEDVLRRHPEVLQAVVTALPDPSGSKRLAAYVVSPQSGPHFADELRGFAQEFLPEYMQPSFIVPLSELPLTPSGKLDRRALPAPESALERHRQFTAPRNPIEARLAGIWRQVLDVDRVGIEDNFFELGGHSLLATQVISQIGRHFQLDLPLRTVFESPTLSALAGRITDAAPQAPPPPITRISRSGPLPLSYAQQRLWFLDRLNPGQTHYNVSAAWQLQGPLDVRVLEFSLNQIQRRHESLRTTFPSHEGRPHQEIAPHRHRPLPLIDLTGLPPATRSSQLESLGARQSRHRFDLAAGPLLQLNLVRLADDDSVLLLTLHHIISDGWSTGVFLEEMEKQFAFRGSQFAVEEKRIPDSDSKLRTANWELPTTPALPVQYPDFAVWQRQRLQGDLLTGQLGYWEERLEGVQALEMPTDRARQALQSFRGGMRRFRLGEGLTRRLHALSQRQGATLFMTLMAAFQVLLHRWTGQTDIVVGTPIANRNHPDLEKLIGFFVNALALRSDLSGDPTFQAAAAQVMEAALQAYAHQDLPFEKLVEKLQPHRELSRNPVFQVILTLQNAPRQGLHMAGLEVRTLSLAAPSTRFDLELHFWEESEGMRGAFAYDRDLFDATTIARLQQHLERLLEQVADKPQLRLSEISLLPPWERQLLLEWAGGPQPLPEQPLIHRLFERTALQRPDAVAVGYRQAQLSYSALQSLSTRLAGRLRRMGAGPESPVAAALERCLEVPAALLGILQSGGAYVPLEPSHPPERQQLLLTETGCRLAVTRWEWAGSIPDASIGKECLESLWGVGSDEDNPLSSAGDSSRKPLPGGPDSLAYILFTSGSTGKPKGVAVSHGSIVRLVHRNGFAEMGPGEVFLQFAPLSFDASTLEIWGALLNGGRLTIAPAGRLSLQELGSVIESRQVTTLWLTAGLFHQMIEDCPQSLAGVRQLLAGGDVLSPSHVQSALSELPQTRLINGYGPTENTTFTCCHTVRDDRQGSVPIGRPIDNTEAYVLDSNGAPVPLGAFGELWIGGQGLARGYWGSPALTADKFRPHPSATPGSRLYRSGDRVRHLPDGRLLFLGRADRQAKIRGFRVEPGEVEAALLAHPWVHEAAVTTGPDASGHKRLTAYVVPAEPALEGEQEGLVLQNLEKPIQRLSDWLSGRLPSFMLPTRIFPLSRLPLTPNGKLDRRALPTPHRDGARRPGSAPRTVFESRLAQIWQEVLQVGQIGPEDDFFEVGGHSLMATQVVSQVRRAFDVELPLRTIFEQPTVAALARSIENLRPGSRRPPMRPADRSRQLPLSFAQQRLWFLHRLVPHDASYNVPVAWRLEGSLDAAALRRALSGIVARHESLRTRFPSLEGRPRQVVDPPRPLPLPVIDLSKLDPKLRDTEQYRLVRREAAQPFDLSQGPVIRASLVLLSPDSSLLLLTLHHIVSDGWSLGVFARELGERFAVRSSQFAVEGTEQFAVRSSQFAVEGTEQFAVRSSQFAVEGTEQSIPDSDSKLRTANCELRTLPIQYPDYAAWQRDWMQGEVLEQQLSYWEGRLRGLQPLELPTDRPRPAVQGTRGGRLLFALPARLNRNLHALGRRHNATLFMTLLAAFQVLLHRYCGQDDIAVGSPIANRNQPEVEGLIGLFVNTLVLRADLSGDRSFAELLQQVRETALQAYVHQDLPFEKLVEHLRPERDLSRNSVFQALFALQNISLRPPRLDGLRVSRLQGVNQTTLFDLELYIWEKEEGLAGVLLYNLDLFDRSRMLRLAVHYRNLLEASVSDSGRRLGELPLLSPAERQQLLREWNPHPHPRPDACAQALFESRSRRTPHASAAVFENAWLSYGELEVRADRLAARLRELGAAPEQLVGLYLQRCLELPAALLAILKSGGAYLPLDPEDPEPRLQHILENSGAALLLSSRSLSGRLPYYPSQTLFIEDDCSIPGGIGSSIQPQNLAYVIYTSGSTGLPKGAAVTHVAVCNHLAWLGERFPLAGGDRVLHKTSLGFDVSVGEILSPLSQGAMVVLARAGGQRDVAYLIDLIRRQGVSLIDAVPSLYQVLAQEEDFGRCRSLRRLFCGGEALADGLQTQILRRLPWAELYNFYGPTEATVDVSFWDCREPCRSSLLPIGRPKANIRLRLLDEWLQPVPAGVAAQLHIAGAGLCRGYLNRPAWTAERFRPDPFAEAVGERLYASGDLARYLPDGNIEFLGRVDQQVKMRGFRIELGEIEAVLRRYPTVAEAAVTLGLDPAGGPRLAAYVAARPDVQLAAVELAGYLGEMLPAYMVPSSFIFLEALPKTPSGKLDRKALPASPEEQQLQSPYAPPENDLERSLVEIWQSVLQVDKVGVGDNFFDLGGHSLLMTQVHGRMSRQLDLKVPMVDLFLHPSIRSLSQHLGAQDRSASPLRQDAERSLRREKAAQRLSRLKARAKGHA